MHVLIVHAHPEPGSFNGAMKNLAAATGTSAETYAPDGIDGDILTVFWPIHNGLLRYTGFDVLPPYVAYMPAREDAATRARQLDGWRRRLEALDTTPHLFFHPAGDYGPDERLRPGVLARSGQQRNV